MLILDWNKNSEAVLKQGYYNTRRSINTEQTHLCQYWQEQGVTKETAYKIWVELESPQVVGCFSEEETREYFDKFWEKALHYGFNRKYIYGLTAKEYNFIEGLDVDKEYKEFLRILVECQSSFGRADGFFCSQEVWEGLIKGTRRQRRPYRVAQMDKWNAQYNLYTMHQKAYFRDGKPVYGNVIELNFFDNKGTVKTDFQFSEYSGTCRSCGKRFIVGKKKYKDLCPDCYKTELTQRKNELKRRSRQAKKT